MVARKTSRLLDRLQTADWKPTRKTDADQQCEFRYQPEGWGQAYRFIALRYKKKEEKRPQEREQYQLFDTPEYIYRVFVTDMDRATDLLVWFYNQRAGAENLIKESNNDAGLAQYPFGALGHQLRAFSTGDAGLQPELLVAAVPAGRGDTGRQTAAHHAGYSAFAFSVCGRQNLEALRAGWHKLQRPICRARIV
jgi:hypothetical protein